jgi:hypothetical protein
LLRIESDSQRIDGHKVDGTIDEVCHFANRRIDCAKS